MLNVIAAVSVRAGQSDRTNTRDFPYMLVIVTPWILEIATFRKVRELRSANSTRIYQQTLRDSVPLLDPRSLLDQRSPFSVIASFCRSFRLILSKIQTETNLELFFFFFFFMRYKHLDETL